MLRPHRLCWGGIFAAATFGLQLWPGLAEQLRFARPLFDAGAAWQLLTAQWVHLSLAHAAVNAMAAVLLCWALVPWVPVRKQLLALLGGYAGVGVLLALDANCLYYAGASGALHGVLAGAAVALIGGQSASSHSGWQRRVAGTALLIALAVKLLVQSWGAASPAPGWLGIPTYYPAHAAGAAGGAVAVLFTLLLQRWHAAQGQAR